MLRQKFSDKHIILASQSPRRKELLQLLDIDFEVFTKQGIDEKFPENLPVTEIAEYLALKKAEEYLTDLTENSIIITADTIVCIENMVLNKPENANEAQQMLELLSDNEHEVITGVCISSKTKKCSFSNTTKVFFKELNTSEIKYYIKNYQPFDKAGAYGIQEWIGATGIKRIEGSYFNVMGLPVQMLFEKLMEF